MLFETVVNFERFNYSRFWSDPEPLMHFKYYGFGWVDAIPVWDMELHVLGLQILAVFIVLGFFYRASIFLFFLGFTYFFLLDQGLYDNHHYLICWVSFAMIFMPASGSFSIDAWWRKSVRCDTTPAWTVAILAGLTGILYFYAGIAKINSDWLQGWPLRGRLGSDFGELAKQEWFVYFMAYSALLFDLLVVPLLVWRKTRAVAFCACILFHLLNMYMFTLAIFPILGIAYTAMFFSPDWPRRWLNWFRRKFKIGVVREAEQNTQRFSISTLTLKQKITVTVLTLCISFHLLFPLRHFLYPGVTLWTGQGYRFSWRVMLRRAYCPMFARGERTDNAFFHVTVSRPHPETGLLMEPVTTTVDSAEFLIEKQLSMMARQSDMILQFAHFLRDEAIKKGFVEIIVTADFKLSLNGRKLQYFVDPKVNLAEIPRNLWHADWIVPLTEPLPDILTWEEVKGIR